LGVSADALSYRVSKKPKIVPKNKEMTGRMTHDDEETWE